MMNTLKHTTMLSNPWRLLLPAIVGLALTVTGEAKAGVVLPTHAFAGAYTLYGGVLDLPGHTVRIQGNGPLDTGFLSDAGGGPGSSTTYVSGSAQATTSLNSDGFLRVSSSASAEGAGLFDPSGVAQGVASYRDIAFVNSTNLPETLRLTFGVDGTLMAQQTSDDSFPSNLAEFGVGTTTNPVNYFDPSQGGTDFSPNYLLEASFYLGNQSGANDNPWNEGFTTQGAWDSFSFNGSTFTGIFHIDTTYDPNLGGYGWGVTTSAKTSAAGGSAEANFLNTVSLQGAALPDGTPVNVSFDSGLTFTSVPEPNAMLIWLCGLLCIAFLRRHRVEKTDEPKKLRQTVLA